jgi:hypothetical protein
VARDVPPGLIELVAAGHTHIAIHAVMGVKSADCGGGNATINDCTFHFSYGTCASAAKYPIFSFGHITSLDMLVFPTLMPQSTPGRNMHQDRVMMMIFRLPLFEQVARNCAPPVPVDLVGEAIAGKQVAIQTAVAADAT